MEACIFCQIAGGKIPSPKLYESEKVVAFRDIAPQAPLHVLIIPKTHYRQLGEIPETELGVIHEMYAAARRLAAEAGIAERGYRLAMNVNAEGGQSVYHVHLHLLGGRPLGASLVG